MTATAWHICISGFTQRQDQPTNGLFRLWWELAQSDSATCRTVYKRWNDDFTSLAATIRNAAGLLGSAHIGVYAYSYGAGWGMPKLAEALAAAGLGITHAVLSDPVHRYRWRMLNWLSLRYWAGSQRVTAPPNVQTVTYWRQAHDPHIQGHKVVAADPNRTHINPGTLVPGYLHSAMDDLEAFHTRAKAIAHALNFAANYGEPPA